MALMGSGALVNWGGIADGAEADYVAWHSSEHMPERVGLPGFLRGRRAEAVAGTVPERRWFMMYETETPEVFASPPYRARLDDPTPWTRSVLATYVAPVRTVCTVVASAGQGIGGWLVTWEAPSLEALSRVEAASALTEWPSIVAAHVLEGLPVLTQFPSAERRFREAQDADAQVGAALIVEALSRAAAEVALDRVIAPACRATIYVTQHVLTPADLE